MQMYMYHTSICMHTYMQHTYACTQHLYISTHTLHVSRVAKAIKLQKKIKKKGGALAADDFMRVGVAKAVLAGTNQIVGGVELIMLPYPAVPAPSKPYLSVYICAV